MDGLTSTTSTMRTTATVAASPVPASTTPATPLAPGVSAAAVGDSVSLSAPLDGHGLLMARLFHRAPTASEPPVRTPYGANPSQGSVYEFLTREDRTFLAAAYETAQQNGLDLGSIDRVAADMGRIRHSANAAPATDMTDLDGNPLPIHFTAEDQAVVDRISTGPAMADTTFPPDMLKSFMDPGRNWLHASDLRDFEALVNVMSPSTLEATPGGAKAIFEKAKTYPQSGPPEEIPTLDQDTIWRKLHKDEVPEAKLSDRDKKTLAVLAILDGQKRDHIANLFAQVALTGGDPAIVDAFAKRYIEDTRRPHHALDAAARPHIDTTA